MVVHFKLYNMANERYLGNQNLQQANSLSLGKAGSSAAFLQFLNGAGVAVGPANTVRLRNNAGVLEKSINGAAYVAVGGGGGDSKNSQQLAVTIAYNTKDQPNSQQLATSITYNTYP